MAEYNAPATLATPGGTILFNRAGDVGFHSPDMCDGLGQAPVSGVTDDKSRTHGGIVYPRLYRARPIVLGGWCRTTTLAGRTAFFDALEAALESIMGTPGTYSWDASTGTRTVTVYQDDGGQLKSLGRWIKRYQFGLVGGDPFQ